MSTSLYIVQSQFYTKLTCKEFPLPDPSIYHSQVNKRSDT